MLQRYFRLAEHQTTVRTEILAGITTFLAMAYIIIVNPLILSDAGMDHGAVFVATCLVAAISTTIMGLYANYPVALAPGMGLNAYFTYGVVKGMGYTWQVGLGAVFISGVISFLISVFPIRSYIINSIPKPLKISISAGIGLFLGMIAMKNAGLVVANPATFVTMGNLTQYGVVLALAGFFVIAALDYYRVPGAIIIGVLTSTVAGIIIGIVAIPDTLVSLPPDITPTLLQLDIPGALQIGLVVIVFSFLFVDIFDTAGTLIGLAHRAGMLDKEGRLPRLERALIADSTATSIGAVLGTSTTTSYIESAAGIRAGGRTGLTAVVVAIFFLAALFFAPFAKMIPAYATASALLYVACMMARGLAEINWDDVTDSAPAVIAALAMPLTFSIANGIALGFISYTAIKILSGKWRDLNIAMIILSVLFVAKIIYLDG